MTAVDYVLLAFLLAAPSVAVLWRRSVGGATVLAAVGAAALLLTRLPDISAFSLYGLSAKLENQSKQVDVSIEQLQKLAAALARANLAQIAMSGQLLSGLSTETKFDFRNQITDSLRGLGVSSAEILKAQDVWIEVYCRLLLGDIESAADEKAKGESKIIEALSRDEGRGLPTPDTLRKYINSKYAGDSKLTSYLDAYEQVWTTGGMKNPALIPFNQNLP